MVSPSSTDEERRADPVRWVDPAFRYDAREGVSSGQGIS
jgi:hypothetical protein